MTFLSRKALLALEAVVDVALHARPNPVQARDITARQGVPQRYLEQLMQSLVRANILRGVRGPNGGYRLARERRRISVLEIIGVIEALDEKDPRHKAGYYSQLGKKVIAPFYARLHKRLTEEIGTTTIADLCEPLESDKDQHSDFNI